MQLTHLRAQGLYSFGSEGISFDLCPDLTVVVGPNASGKSNLGALVDLVMVAVAWAGAADPNLQPWARRDVLSEALRVAATQARNYRLPLEQPVEARLGVKLTSDAEKEKVASFMRAVIASSPNSTGALTPNTGVESWAADLPVDAFAALFCGELVITHSGVAGTDWRVRFDPSDEIGGVRVAIRLNSSETMLVRADDHLRNVDRGTDLATLLGFPAKPEDTPRSAPPEPDRVLSRLVPESGSGTALSVRRPNTVPELLPAATRDFLRKLSLDAGPQPTSAWGLGVVWEDILRRGVSHLRPDGASVVSFDVSGLPSSEWAYSAEALTEPPSLVVGDLPRRLWELHNGGHEGVVRLSAVQEEFAQLAPGWEFAVAGTLVPSTRRPDQTPLQLVVEPNISAFAAAADPSPVRAAPLAATSGNTSVDMSLHVQITACKDNGIWEPLARAGTGVAQALVLAEALGDSADRFVFLDEPGVNLHPNWQRQVRNRLDHLSSSDGSGGAGQFLMVTHAAPLAAPIKSGCRLPARVVKDATTSTVIAPPEDLPGDWPTKDLQLSPESWGLLFADGVVLVEGETELGALPVWFEKIDRCHMDPTEPQRCEQPWSARNIVLYNVGGHNNFEKWIRYLHYYQVPWAIVCDGIILNPYEAASAGRSPAKNWILLQVAKAQGDNQLLKKMEAFQGSCANGGEPPCFESVLRLANKHRVFSLANSFTKPGRTPAPPPGTVVESIDDLIAGDATLAAAKMAADATPGGRSSKVRVGLYVADACDPPPAVSALHANLVDWSKGSEPAP